MTIYDEAARTISHPEEHVGGADFRRMMLAILSAPIDFPNDDAAEDCVRRNEYGVGRVVERGVRVQTFYGAKHK